MRKRAAERDATQISTASPSLRSRRKRSRLGSHERDRVSARRRRGIVSRRVLRRIAAKLRWHVVRTRLGASMIRRSAVDPTARVDVEVRSTSSTACRSNAAPRSREPLHDATDDGPPRLVARGHRHMLEARARHRRRRYIVHAVGDRATRSGARRDGARSGAHPGRRDRARHLSTDDRAREAAWAFASSTIRFTSAPVELNRPRLGGRVAPGCRCATRRGGRPARARLRRSAEPVLDHRARDEATRRTRPRQAPRHAATALASSQLAARRLADIAVLDPATRRAMPDDAQRPDDRRRRDRARRSARPVRGLGTNGMIRVRSVGRHAASRIAATSSGR